MQHCGAFAQYLFLFGYSKSLIQLNASVNNKTYLDFDVHSPIYLHNFNQIWKIFLEVPQHKFHRNQSSGGHVDIYGADGRVDG